MAIALLVSAIGLLLLPGLVRPLGRRLPSAEWARLCTVLLAVGAGALEGALLAVGATTVLHLAGQGELADLCERLLGTALLGGVPSGLVAAAAAVALAVLAARQVLRSHRSQRAVRVEPALGRHGAADGYDLVVLPSRRLFAFGVAGRPGQVVVSDGLVEELTSDELAAVLRHEGAHLRHRHERHLLFASVVEHTLGLLPLVRRSTSVLRCALERWADEEAVTSDAARASVRSALLRVQAMMLGEVAAFVTAGTVVERIEALEAGPRRSVPAGRRALVYGPAAVLLLVAVASAGVLLEHVAVVHLILGLCPLT